MKFAFSCLRKLVTISHSIGKLYSSRNLFHTLLHFFQFDKFLNSSEFLSF